MDHKQFEHLLPDLAAGTLDRADSDLLQAHLQHCAVCIQQLEGFRQVMSELRSAKETKSAPDGYFANIVPRFRLRLQGRSDRSTGFGWLQLAPPFAAAVIVLGLLATLQGPIGSNGSNGSNGLRSLVADLESAEVTDAFLSEIDQQPLATMDSDDVLAGTLDRGAVSRDLLERIAESAWGDLAPLQTVEDLESDELDVLLQRLESRTYL